MYATQLQSHVTVAHIESDRITHDGGSVAVVDAIVTVDDSGTRWVVAMMNRHPTEVVRCTLKLRVERLDGSYEAMMLTGDSTDAYNDIEHPDRVVPRGIEMTFENGSVDLPPHSLSILEISLKQ